MTFSNVSALWSNDLACKSIVRMLYWLEKIISNFSNQEVDTICLYPITRHGILNLFNSLQEMENFHDQFFKIITSGILIVVVFGGFSQ